MALRIERWLGRDRSSAAEVWLAQQTAFDLWQARAALKRSRALAIGTAYPERLIRCGRLRDDAGTVTRIS